MFGSLVFFQIGLKVVQQKWYETKVMKRWWAWKGGGVKCVVCVCVGGGRGDVLVAPWGSWWRGQKSARLSSDVMFKVCDYVLYRELILCVYNKAWQRGGTGPPPPNKKMKIAEDLNWIVTLTCYKLIEKGHKMLHKNSQKKSVLICPPPPVMKQAAAKMILPQSLLFLVDLKWQNTSINLKMY